MFWFYTMNETDETLRSNQIFSTYSAIYEMIWSCKNWKNNNEFFVRKLQSDIWSSQVCDAIVWYLLENVLIDVK